MKHEVKHIVSKQAPMMKGLMGSIATQAVSLLAQQNPVSQDEWVREMFARGDKDASGTISFDEFVAFFQTDAKAEKAQREHQLREALAGATRVVFLLNSLRRVCFVACCVFLLH